MAGQTINDRLLAARHSIAGQGLAKSVCKATTEEMIGPKKKHLDYLIHCTNEPNVSIPQMANLLIERSQNTNWVVVFKALITVHHMLCYGNERFTQYLASSNSTFQLSNFLDKSGVQGARVVTASGGGSVAGYDMSPFIRRYAKYLNEKALSYRTVAFDFCKVKRGKEDGTLRTMNAEKLLKTLPVLQAQLDALLEFDCTANDLTNGVINMAFMLLFRDLIRLFACYNDGIINLLEKYFDMNKKQCRDALDLYKKFLIRMDRVAEFLKVAENVGIDKGDIPDLTKAPSSLLDALEQHLASLEGKKGSAANTPTQTASNRTNVKSGVSALSSTSTAFGTAANNTRLDSHTGSNGIDESLKQQALAEEEAAMNQYKAKVSSPTASSTNPFLSSPTSGGAPVSQSQPIVDLFGSPTNAGLDSMQATKASDDLLQLSGNPFADMFGGGAVAPAPPVAAPAPAQDMWLSNGFGAAPAAGAGAFVSDQSFSSVFGAADAGSAAAGMGAAAAAGAAAAQNPFMSDFGGAAELVAPAPAAGGLFDAPPAAGPAPEGASSDPFGGGDLFGDADAGVLQPTEALGEGAGADATGSGPDADGAFPSAAAAAAAGKAASPPPPRPPPPAAMAAAAAAAATGTGSPRTASPAPLGGSPSRPPPPGTAVAPGAVPAAVPPIAAAAPSPIPVAAGGGAPKSAFDDLNESIRAALGGSPSRPTPPAGGAPVAVTAAAPAAAVAQQPVQPQPMAAAFAGFGSFDLGGGGPVGAPTGPGAMGGPGGMMFGAPAPAPSYGSPAKQGMAMAGFDALGDILAPVQPLHTSTGPVTAGVGGGLMQPAGAVTDGPASGKVLTGDLDSSLASLAQNLTINKGGQAAVKGVQWNSPKNAAKPGAAGWTPQPMAATTGAGYRPMGQGMAMNVTVQFPTATPLGMAGMRPMAPGAVGAPMPGMMAGAVPAGAAMMAGPRIPGVGGPAPGQSPQQPPLDPFGAL